MHIGLLLVYDTTVAALITSHKYTLHFVIACTYVVTYKQE
jgi:hypothetical protein